MSPLLWLQRLFVPKPDSVESNEPVDLEPTPFIWSQHLRIVLALLIVLISSGVLWWILM